MICKVAEAGAGLPVPVTAAHASAPLPPQVAHPDRLVGEEVVALVALMGSRQEREDHANSST